MSEELRETNIRRVLCEKLQKDKDLVVVSKWKDVGFGADILHPKKKRSLLFGEFDIITFRKQRTGDKLRLLVTGYEIKGYTQYRGKYIAPNNKDGITQALALLYDGADLAYLVRPIPEKEADHLIRFCNMYVHAIDNI